MKQHVHIANRVLALLVALVMLPALSLPVFAAGGTWSGGDGTTKEEAYLISTAEDLAQLAEDVNGGETYTGKYFLLTNDIDLTDWIMQNSNTEGWVPIGKRRDSINSQPFSGVFDGGGHTISGLWINRPNDSYAGLFGFVRDGEIQNLRVETARDGIKAKNFSGVLAGYFFRSTIRSCHAEGAVTGTHSGIGGLVGWVNANEGKALIENSSFDGTVVGVSGAIGGLVGAASYNCTIRNCYVTGSVSYSASAEEVKVGGLVGVLQTESLIDNCYASANVSGISSVGGLVGDQLFSTSIRNSYWNTDMKQIVSGTERQGAEKRGVGEILVSADKADVIDKTTAELKQKTTFKGWDFRNDWLLVDGTSFPRLPGDGHPDYYVNHQPGNWTDRTTIPLSEDGDTLTLFAGAGPKTPVNVSVNSLDNASFAIIGRPSVTYENVSISVSGKNTTLRLTDLLLQAPQNQNGISFNTEGTSDAHSKIHAEGVCTIKGGDASHGIATLASSLIIEGEALHAYGGDNIGTGGHGVYASNGNITVADTTVFTATGGAGTVEGGNGIHAAGAVTIAKHKGDVDVYVRGGTDSTNEQSASIAAGNAYLATGNIGPVIVNNELKNTPDGDNLYMLTADTSPLKQDAVFEAVVKTEAEGLSPSYTYRTVAKDGVAYLWLPEGRQTVTSAGYGDGSAAVPTDPSVTLYNDFNITINYKEGNTVLKTETSTAVPGGNIPLIVPDGYALAAGVLDSLTLNSALMAGGQISGCMVTVDGKTITVDVPMTPREILVTVTYRHGTETSTETINKIYNTQLGRNELQRVPFGYEPNSASFPLAINTQTDGLNFNFTASQPTAAVTIDCAPKQYEITVTYKDGGNTAGTQTFADVSYDGTIDAAEFVLPTGYQLPDGFINLPVTQETITFAAGASTGTADVMVEKTEYSVTVRFMDEQAQVGGDFPVEGVWTLGDTVDAEKLTLPDGYAFDNFSGISITAGLIESSAQGTDITVDVAVQEQQISVTLQYQYGGSPIGQSQSLNKGGTDSIAASDVILPSGYHLAQPWTEIMMTDSASFDAYDVDLLGGTGTASKSIAVEPNEVALTVHYKQGETPRGSMTLTRNYDARLAPADFTGIDDGFTLPVNFAGLTVNAAAGWRFDENFTAAEIDVQVVPADYTVTIQYDDKAGTVYPLADKIAYTGSFLPAGMPDGYRLASDDAVTLEIGALDQNFDHAARTVTILVPLTPLDYVLTITYLDDGAFVGRQMETVPFDSDFSAFSLPRGYALSNGTQVIAVDSGISNHRYRSAMANVSLVKKTYDAAIQYSGYSGDNATQILFGKRLGDRIAFSELTIPEGCSPIDFTDLTLTASHISDTDTITIEVPVAVTELEIKIQYTQGETVVGTQVKNMKRNDYLRKSDLNPPFGYRLSGAFADMRITQAQSIAVPVEVVPAQTVAVSPAAVVLVLNDTPSAYLTAQVSPSVLDMGVTWASENEAVATVDEYGKVTAVAKGFTIINAISRQTETVMGRCMVTVASLGDPYVTTADLPRPSWSNAAYAVTLAGQNLVDGNTIEFRLNDGEWMPYSEAVAIAQEGETWLSWRVTAGTNFLSEGKFGPYLVDLTAPVITEQTVKAASASQIDLSAAAMDSNGIAGYLWEVKDGESWVVLSINESYSHTGLSANTEYTYRLTVTDLAGNTTIDEIAAKTNRASSGGSSTAYYTVTFDTNGGSAVESQHVRRNGKAAKPADPEKEGFAFAGWYTDSKWTAEYDFDKIVTNKFTLYAKWTEDTGTPVEPDGWENPFMDVKESDWFYGNVRYVYENNLFNGLSKQLFGPNDSMTRAMLVTVLWRAEGQPETGDSSFADIPSDEYFAKAVAWAAANGIVNGYDDKTFAPDDTITREQLAAMLYRYAGFKGYDISVGDHTTLLSYGDAAQISEWAISAVHWAVGVGIITGRTQDIIAPQDSATRAEVAAMLQRFLEK